MKILLGNEIHGDKDTIQEIIEINEAMDYAIVEGTLFDLEKKGPYGKDASYLYKGAIWDGTNSMYFQFFHYLEIELKQGMRVKMSGSTEKNQYTKGEYVLKVDNVTELPKLDVVRVDEAPVKRVELSVVGNYSTQISALTGEQIVHAAKAMGHRAVALTDIGAVQGFPEAYSAAKKADMKLILGLKMPVVDDRQSIVAQADDRSIYDTSYTVFDVETTGFSVVDDHIIEIGATKFEQGVPVARYQTFVQSPKKVPIHITELTGITPQESDKGVTLAQAVDEFHAFWQGTVLVAQNAQFDIGHLTMAYERVGRDVPPMIVVDTMQLSRQINTDMKLHGLKNLAKRYKVELASHHRADQDAEATGHIWIAMFEQLRALGLETLQDINERLMDDQYFKSFFAGDVTILVQNQVGLQNLYQLISLSHSTYLGKVPMLPLRVLEQYREGLLIGSGSHEGRLFELALNKSEKDVAELVSFFDYVEIQPTETVSHYYHQTKAQGPESIERAYQTIIRHANEQGKVVVATGYVHYVEKEDRLAQHILMYNVTGGRKRGGQNDIHGYLHLRTTSEMMEGLTYVPGAEKQAYVVDHANLIADMCEEVAPLPNQLFTPDLPDADDRLKNESYEKARALYGDVLPELVEARLEKEVKSILKSGFAVVYTISADLVKKSNSDGYLVGSRGSVGSSFVATMLGITEVNPLRPHYNCPSCKWSMFFNHEELQSGYDLPTDFKELFKKENYSEQARQYFFELFAREFGAEKVKEMMTTMEPDTCPTCGGKHLIREGQDIPFETFLGFKGDKVPDIDLNFSGEYQSTAHAFVGESKEAFGLSEVYRAGTIGTVADKTAFGYAINYMKEQGFTWSRAETARIASQMVGAKRTTGQHAGGIIIVPKGKTISEFGGMQYPAHDLEAQYPTTHYAFEHIHDFLLKLDILGHDDPTILRLLKDSTGIDPRTVPANDEKALKLFTEPEAVLGVPIDRIEALTGTLGVPEFGTQFVQQMVVQTKPKSFAELVKISGLSHGTDVWLNNAQSLVENGVCEFKEVIGCRDDIMVYLSQKGLEESLAFTIMESVRKGKGVKDEWIEEMLKNNVPEWYIESCKKIKYMFPKAHAAAYVLSAMRVAYFKAHHPIHYYAAMLSVRWAEADVTEVIKPAHEIRRRIGELEKEIDSKTKRGETTSNEKKMVVYLKVVHEAKERGIEFGNVQIYGSDPIRWKIDGNVIIPPFISIAGLGDKAAYKLKAASEQAIFQGVDDLIARGGVNKTNVEVLRGLGCLELIETKQHVFF